jgi:two-component system sensor histidine kinase ResE
VVVDVTEAERLQRMRVDFVANASHQLRTPLTSVRGYLEAVADGTAEGADERARCLAVALDQVGLLQRLVDQLLQLSRLQAGARPLEAVPLDLAQVARRAAEHLEPQAADRGVQVHVEADESPTFGDPDLLVQAVHNLLDNAIRHSPPGATVTVGLRATPGGYELAVADQGDGLGATEPELLWQRFQSAGGNGGAGLGLPIAKEIVEAHGGTVFARAGDDGGAVFGFRLPREAGDPGE